METLLKISRAIDGLNEKIGRLTYWLVLVAVLISAGNAVIRYAFNMSSNAWLEIQWYLFSAIFLFCAGYTLLHNQHIRIDVVTGRFSKRVQAWIDIFGTIFFLSPMAVTIMWLSWPVFVDTYQRHEVSSNAGGLVIWPARLLVRSPKRSSRCGSRTLASKSRSASRKQQPSSMTSTRARMWIFSNAGAPSDSYGWPTNGRCSRSSIS